MSDAKAEDYRPPMGTVIVVHDRDGSAGQDHALRIFLSAGNGGTVEFESTSKFSKPEADYRAVQVARLYRLRFEALPTRPYQLPTPMQEGNP